MFHANILGRMAATVVRVPYVFSGIRVAEHSARWHNRMERMTRRLVSHHICVSHDVARFAVEHFRLREEDVSVVPNGVEWERFAHAIPVPLSEFGIPDGSRTILGVGRLHPQKGWLTLLEAAEQPLQEDPNLHLLIVGEGPQRRALEKWVTDHQLDRQVHLPGWQSDVAGIMRSCELFVLPSLWEGMPNVLLESMASGLPVVATNVSGVAECLPPGCHDRLVKPNEAMELRAGLVAALSDPAGARQQAQTTQNHVKEHFTWTNTARIWSEIALSKSNS
jgi:starch synthase (maltosyl-transferring)